MVRGADLLRLQRMAGNHAVAGMLQRYYEPQVGNSKATYRFSDNDGMAVRLDQAEGGKQVWATKDLMDSANTTLEAAGSAISLQKGGDVTWPQDNGNVLTQVAPTIRDLKKDVSDAADAEKLKAANRPGAQQTPDSEGVKDATLALWTDCGRASRVVTGGQVAARYKKGKISASTRKSYDPAVFSNTVYSKVIVPFMEADASTPYMKEGVHYTVDPDDADTWLLLAPTDADQARRMYWELGTKGRTAFDKFAGINAYANPEIGQTYTIVSENQMPGFKRQGFTWNFHWAGVIMKDGGDNLTLEGYAVMAGDKEIADLKAQYSGEELKKKLDEMRAKYATWINRDWVCQMYGTKKLDQTFHQQHLKSGTHGTRATTMAAGTK
jgi:hypothetical protein